MAMAAAGRPSQKRKATADAAAHGAKRSRTSGVPDPAANAPFNPSTASDEIRTKLQTCRESSRPLKSKRKSVLKLCSIFSQLLAEGRVRSSASSTVQDLLGQWFLDRYQDYRGILFGGVRSEPHAEALFALRLVMHLFGEDVGNAQAGSSTIWTLGTFPLILEALVARKDDGTLILIFWKSYVQPYEDSKYFFFLVLKSIAGGFSESEEDTSAERLVNLFMNAALGPQDTEDVTKKAYFNNPPSQKMVAKASSRAYIKEAAEVWTSLMRGRISPPLQKKMLQAIPHHVAPWFPRKEALMDFLSDAFSVGGSRSLLAISGLLDLIQDKGLDFPDFYRKLYGQLDRDVLYSKHRSRFLRIVDRALRSSHLPAVLVASFIKRLSRLLMFAPPAAIVVVVPWTYNLLHTHPSCRFLIHRISWSGYNEQSDAGEKHDPFDMNAPDPMDTNAIDSSLWELVTLQSHYHPNVSAIATILSQQFLKQGYNLEDFLDHTYGSMMESELSKTLTKPPVVEYEIPKNIFSGVPSDENLSEGSLMNLWNFDAE